MSIHSNEYNLQQVLSESGDLYVPWFQRDYTWDGRNIDDLFMDLFDEYSWENILESSQNNTPLRDYFLGAVMLCGKGDGRRMILDGQQRLTTLTMLLACLLRRMSQYPELQNLHKAGVKILRNNENENRLELKKGIESSPLESDQNVYSQIMEALHHNGGLAMDQNSADPLNIALSKRQIYDTYTILSVKLDDHISLAGISEKDAIKKLYKIITENLIFVSIRTDDEDYAIKFFETLNARGEDLRPDDLVKNALFLQANNSNELRNLVVSQWDTFVKSLSEPNDRIDFLRFDWNSRRNFIGKSRIYRSYKELFQEFGNSNLYANISDFCNDIVFSSDCYKGISKATRQYDFCSGLVLIGAKICRPVLLAVNRKFATDLPPVRFKRLREVTRILESVMMRCSICEQVTTALEKGFAQAAVMISSSNNSWEVVLSDIKNHLTDPVYRVPTDDEFKNRLQNVVLHQSDLVKYKWRAFFATLYVYIANPERISIPAVSDIKLSYISNGNAQYHQSIGNILTTITDNDYQNTSGINPTPGQMIPGRWNAASISAQKQRVIDTALACWSLE